MQAQKNEDTLLVDAFCNEQLTHVPVSEDIDMRDDFRQLDFASAHDELDSEIQQHEKLDLFGENVLENTMHEDTEMAQF